MRNSSNERFQKWLRIRKHANYVEVQRTGLKVTSRRFIGLVKPKVSGPTRLGIITTKRYGNAVTRNRVRRLIKEAFRRGLLNLPNKTDFIVIPKKVPANLIPRLFSRIL